MKQVHSARYLTFLYFSIVAVALVAIHVSVYWQTTEDLEHLYGQNRMDQIKLHAGAMLADVEVGNQPGIRIKSQGFSELDKGTEVVFDFDRLPDWIPDPEELEWDRGVEALSKTTDEAYFVMKTKFETAAGPRDAVLLMDFRLYELSEEQLFASHAKQVALSAVLLIISLFAVIKIANRLTRPISRFASSLANKPTTDLDPLPLPKGASTTELVGMVESFNRYLERLRLLMERERSFSRYASHEMRSPLTVMSGALTLMEESDDPAFVAVQRDRLREALAEISELIETLLELTRSEKGEPGAPWVVTTAALEHIASEHEHLLSGKALTWRVNIKGSPVIRMPEPTFRILLGNLVKNSFTYAQEGEVLIEASDDCITVSDAGAVHDDAEHIKEGFGLGLLLVRDICGTPNTSVTATAAGPRPFARGNRLNELSADRPACRAGRICRPDVRLGLY
jgi:signal transduction histidine kinase